VCVSTGVLLCALRNDSFGNFFRMLNSDVRRNTYSLRKHWRLIKIYLSNVFLRNGSSSHRTYVCSYNCMYVNYTNS
jgi:hypothetical protein